MPDIIETVHLSKGKVVKVVKVASKQVPLVLVIGLDSWPKGYDVRRDITQVSFHHNYKDGVVTYAD